MSLQSLREALKMGSPNTPNLTRCAHVSCCSLDLESPPKAFELKAWSLTHDTIEEGVELLKSRTKRKVVSQCRYAFKRDYGTLVFSSFSFISGRELKKLPFATSSHDDAQVQRIDRGIRATGPRGHRLKPNKSFLFIN
jgi:hypothetical protein